MIEDGFTIDTEGFSRDVGRFALLTGRSFGEELKIQARGAMRGVVRVTPPFHGGNSASEAKRAGENAISRDLTRQFRAVDLVGSRKVTHLFGKPHPSAPWIVPEKEKHPDVTAYYVATKKLDSRGRRARYQKPIYVDAQKYRTLQQRLEKRVGFLGGGFREGAAGLGVALPAFMRRHSSAPGKLIMKLEGDELYIIIRNDVSYGSKLYDFVRRVEWAVQAQRGKMERQIPYLLKRHEKLLN